MKKITFALMAMLALSFSLKAQQIVSTEPANRNVILEEFTGRNCGYCPDGHLIANQIAASNPGRFFAVNVHAGGYAPTSYPNFNTPDGATILGGFNVSGFPSGVVNRSTASAQGRGSWASLANQQFGQQAECNVAGRALVNLQTRVATITVEVYYTGNSTVDENYLTVAMLQDSIWGSQSGGSTNPTQWVNGQYCHMHILRDVITTSAWGDAISPTTQGTLITKTYEYQIPESIGNPNGVEVDLDNIFFLAWVSEKFQGTPTRPILNACELEMVQGSDEPIYPMIKEIAQVGGATCTHTKTVNVRVQNGGTETLTSMVIEAELEGQTTTVNWEGSLERFGAEDIELAVEVPFGTYDLTVRITEANGQALDIESEASLDCMEWQDLVIEGDSVEMRLEIMQDKFGNQITWDMTTPDGTVLGAGGPYIMLVGGSGTQMHIEHVTVPVNECVKFTIRDSAGNGICCTYGQGYFILKDGEGNVVFGDENNGDFDSEVSRLISVKDGEIQVEVGATEVTNVSATHADFMASLTYDGFPDEVGFSCRKVTSSEPIMVEGFLNEFQKILGSTDALEPESIYMVKAYAIVNGETYYGAEATFQTLPDGVSELENSLRLYPNPTASVLNIEGEGVTGIEVYNTVGQCLLRQKANGNKAQVNTEGLNNGVYFIRIMADDGMVLNRTFTVAK